VTPRTYSAAGDTVTYHFLVTNTGSVTLTDLSIDETAFTGTGHLSAITCPVTTLAPGRATTCTATYTVTAADVRTQSVDNTAVALGDDPGGNPTRSNPSSARITAVSTPVIRTRTAHGRALAGARIRDRVVISGLRSGHTAPGRLRLYGPFARPSGMACGGRHLVATLHFTGRDGVWRSPRVKVAPVGFYTWVASLAATGHSRRASDRCGVISETTLVHKRSYGSPVVDAGYSGVEPDPAATRTLLAEPATTVRYASLGISAPASMVGVRGHAVAVPADVAELGQVEPSAGLSDLIGTTVIVGHVSDDHDAPGAFYRLADARRGQIVRIRHAGRTYRYRVTSIRTYARAQNGHPPASVFSTTGPHRLALISCTDKVVYPDGHFHYLDNVVVMAKAIR
jgi:hypothetical protein